MFLGITQGPGQPLGIAVTVLPERTISYTLPSRLIHQPRESPNVAAGVAGYGAKVRIFGDVVVFDRIRYVCMSWVGEWCVCKLAWASELCTGVPSIFASANLRFLFQRKHINILRTEFARVDVSMATIAVIDE